MADDWTRERLQRHLDDQIQEDLNLDYKGAGSLDKSDRKKLEIHKDVSAMANSAGGVVIYGIREYAKDRRHLPERFDPVDQSVFTREWLEQVISGVQPRIQGLVITPVPIGPNPTDAIFVVEVPASSTAHQAGDKRYYKRYNFESVAMNDYEIRDVMNRSAHALIDLEFQLELEHRTVDEKRTVWRPQEQSPYNLSPFASPTQQKEIVGTKHLEFARLKIYARNSGAVYAQYIVAHLNTSPDLLDKNEHTEQRLEDGSVKVRFDNNQVASSGHKSWLTQGTPVLPGMREFLGYLLLDWDSATAEHNEATVKWEVFADNARVRQGSVQMAELLEKAEWEETHTVSDPMSQFGM